ncbi:hypothetical protein NXY56_000619 [Leishmania guyanensis]|uniref:Uncharacterized protein n=1 Tax=Leishmania guyanensis TaxID=5670 RepID=A0A1E1IP98_LEIGU|nr:hypothetical protein, conserved [Leishmania guyanensis]
MKAAAPPTRAPRPPQASRSDPNSTAARGGGAAAAAAVTAMPETQVRRRLTQVEMRLRDIDEEARRISVLQEQEVSKLENDNAKLRERLEAIRMEECMSLAEVQALKDYASYERTSGAPAGRSESKLIGSTTLKYQNAKAEVQKRRRECAQAERQLAESQARLADVRKARKELKRQNFTAEVSAAARSAAADNYRALIHERFRGLEERVAREQERLNAAIKEAQEVRTEIDTLLVSQTSNDTMCHRQCDALLAKRREMAYLMEVCNLVCEERQCVVAELTEMQARMAEESHQYEAVFDELTGVQNENAKAQAANNDQLEELRRIIMQTRVEREGLEEDNNNVKAAIERQHRRTTTRHLNDETRAAAASESNLSSSAFAEERGIATADGVGPAGRDGGAELQTPESELSLDSNQAQVRLFEDYYRRLSAIVQSDAIEDVVGFMDTAADERYKVFEEVNAIKRNMVALEKEKAALMMPISGGAGDRVTASYLTTRSPGSSASVSESVGHPFTSTSALAALAVADTLEDLTTATASMAAEKSGGSSVPGTSTEGRQERSSRMFDLLDNFGAMRDRVYEQEKEEEESAAVLAQVVEQVNEVFRGLGCSIDELRILTGLEGVQQGTLLQCLAMVEERASEYLIAYSRQQQQLLLPFSEASHPWPGAPANAAAVVSATCPEHTAAHTLLRRLDLRPRAKKNAVAATVMHHALPRSTDVTTVMPNINARPTGSSTTFENLVEDRPLSEVELREVVEAKRALLQP